jgi:hypothetical protein
MVKRYQRGVIRSRNSTKDRQHNGQKIPKGLSEAVTQEGQTTQWSKDTKGVIRSRNSTNEGQTTQWSKEKRKKDKQRSIKQYTEN